MNAATGKTKVLFVVHRMSIGGVQRSLLSLLNALDYDRFDVTLYVRRDQCELLPQVDSRVGKIVINRDATHHYRRPYAVLLSAAIRIVKAVGSDPSRLKERLDRYIRESRMRHEKRAYFSGPEEPDLAVSYIQGYTAQFVAEQIPAKRKIVFYHADDDDLHALHERIFPSFDKIVTVNEGCAAMLRSNYPDAADKICVLHNYIDPQRVRQQAKAYEIEREKDKIALCTCGRFSPEKGFELALDAAQILKRNGIGFLWYFVGDGPQRAALEQKRAELGLDDEIRMTGMLEDPYPYLANCDIYVQPSLQESYGLTIAEAQILAVPVVTTATVGGMFHVKDGDTGLIAETTAAGLAETIGMLIGDSALYGHIRQTLRQTDLQRDIDDFKQEICDVLSF